MRAPGAPDAGSDAATLGAPRAGADGRAARGSDRRRRWVPVTAGIVTLAVGLRDIVLVVRPQMWERLRAIDTLLPGSVDPNAVRGVSAAVTLVAGTLLVLLSHALRRRKRRAWRAVVALLVVTVVAHVVRGHDGWSIGLDGAVIIDCVLLAALVYFRREFFALGDPRTRWRALGAFLVLASVSLGLGVAIIGLRPGSIAGPHSFGDIVAHAALGLVGVSGPLHFASDRIDDLVTATLIALGGLTAITTVYLFFRPAEPPAILDADDERAMRELLSAHGERDSLGYFALRRDKSAVWSPSGKSCVAYRVVSGVMLASGDPLGDPEAWPGAIHEFMATAQRHAWVPAVVACSELGGAVWARETGLSVWEIGDEAVVDVASFSLSGRAMRNVRQMVNRVERLGYSCEIHRVADLPLERTELLRSRAASWRGAEKERGFSMALGRLGDPADDDCVAVGAYLDGVLHAFLHFVPWDRDGLSLDLMRRDRAGDPGLNEYLITSALRACPALGVRRVSLNFAMFRSALERGERLGAGPVMRAWRTVLVFASRWFQIESLYRFNAKFAPTWQPRYLVYPSASALPRIVLAALEAEAFLVWPHPTLRRVRRLLPLRVAASQDHP